MDGIMKVKIYAGLVCPRRSLDCIKLENYFLANGCEIAARPEEATVIVIITCAFIDRNISESVDLIEACKPFKARILVGGCIKDIAGETLARHFSGEVFTTREIEKIDDFFPGFRVGFQTIPDANKLHDYHGIESLCGSRERFSEEIFSSKTKFHFWDKEFTLRLGYGCDCRCTYCSHREAIGPYRSKEPGQCLEEFKKGYDQGFRYFRLTSMDTGRYGLDFGTTLPGLIDRFLGYGPDGKFVLEDINPMWLNKYFDEILRLSKDKKISAIQSPMQSGSPAVLRKMRRWKDTDRFLEQVRALKDSSRLLHLSTELLVGFPGETEEDFEKTKQVLKEGRFDFTYIYPYFENTLMESSGFFPKCGQETINQRIESMVSFCREYRISFSVMTNTGNKRGAP
jgi:threonylcarbamoyladenosine tRNA methylthiotransferase MtaB